MDNKKHTKRAKNFIGQLLRFNIIGAVNTGVTYAFYALLVELGVHHLVAVALEYMLGVVISFTLNHIITFKTSRRGLGRRFLRMLWSYSVLLGLNMGLLWLLVDHWGYNELFSQLACLIVVTTLSFTVQKFYVFRKEPRHGVSS